VKSLEDELRELYRAVTETIREQDLPGLHEPRARTRRRSWLGGFAPLAAAAAVVVAIGLGVAVPTLVSAPSRPAPPASAAAPSSSAAPAPTATSPAPASTLYSPGPTLPGSTTLPPSCPATLTEGNDGTITPLFCSDGSPNPAALAYYEGRNDRGFNPVVLRLAPSSTQSQVESAMCADIGPGGTMGLQTEQQAYDLAARRNGWSYDINTVTNLRCPPAG
jgi:hypothetical protein